MVRLFSFLMSFLTATILTASTSQAQTGFGEYFPPWEMADLTGPEVFPGPKEWRFTSHPNPFNPSTHITYSLPREGLVFLAVYNAQGREVARLLEGYKEAGYYSALWDGRDTAGSMVSTGVYFARLEVRDSQGKVLYLNTAKLLLAK